MKRTSLALLLIFAALQAQALGSLANIEIIDRDTGASLTIYRHRGEYWIAGRPGGRYSISVRNQCGQRLLAVASVDGINVISGETGAWNQSGYVFGPGERYEIAGWRKSNQQIAAFEFTAASRSYAERTGRPDNVGVIGVAIFREQAAEESQVTAADGAIAAPAMPPTASEARRSYAAKLGTGHGAREYSYAQTTQFERLTSEPNEIVRIRYESFDRLVAMGVLRSYANPFPDSVASQYVPDPPGDGR